MEKGDYDHNLMKRWLILLFGLTVMAFGIAFSIQAETGNTPVSGLPYVISLFSKWTVGEWTVITHCIFILIQIIILGRSFRLHQMLQLVVAFFFGSMTDIALWCIRGVTFYNYMQQIAFCCLGIFLVAVGISLEVVADVITLAGEGVVLAISKTFCFRFSNVKIAFDMTLVAVSCVLSLLFLHRIEGVREGTVLAALFVGVISKPLIRIETKILGINKVNL